MSPESLIALSWNPASEGPPQAPKHGGGRFDVFFFNERSAWDPITISNLTLCAKIKIFLKSGIARWIL
ncbi:MAG: hypothetical protein CMD99_10415 [Gammaproteobacteria bacterium]|nr:hypothetical protein [Gammaproteobacteria bacterium]